MEKCLKIILLSALGYVGVKCAEALASNTIESINQFIDGAIQFWVYDNQQARGISPESNECVQQIGFEIPSEEIEDAEDKYKIGFGGS